MLSRQQDPSAFPFLFIDQPRPTGPLCLPPCLKSSVSGGRSFAERRREKGAGGTCVSYSRPLTWSPAGRCCSAPSCPGAALTPEWWARLQCPERGRGWGCGPLSGCFCLGCWPTGGTACGGCAVAAAGDATWSDCGDLQALWTKQAKSRTTV